MASSLNLEMNNKVRKEVYDEMKKKDLEIRDLKEALIKLKIKDRSNMSDLKRMMDLNLLRDEIKMADGFLKAVLKDSLINYEVSDNTKEEKKDDDKVSTVKKMVKEYQMSSIEKMNMANCQCSTCLMNKKAVFSFLKNSKKSLSKMFRLTDKVSSMVHFDGTKYCMDVNMESDKIQDIKVKKWMSLEEVVTIKFIWRRSEGKFKEDYNFGIHPSMFSCTFMGDLEFKSSVSSYLVVKGMREEMEASLSRVDSSIEMNFEMKDNCFTKFYEELTKMKLLDERANSICMLTEEEEMNLVTLYGRNEVFISVVDGELNNKKNHISSMPFLNSVKIMIYLLITPQFRRFKFYTSEEDNIMEGVKLVNEMDEDMMNPHWNLNTPTDEGEVTESNFEEKNKRMDKTFRRVLEKNYGSVIGSFYETVFVRRNSSEEFNSFVVKEMFNSFMAEHFMQSFDLDFGILFLMNISFNQFLASMYLIGNYKSMCHYIYNEDLMILKNRLLESKYHFVANRLIMDNKYLEKGQEWITSDWVNFVKSINDNVFMDNDLMKRMFWDFKKRMFYYVSMHKVCWEENGQLSSSLTSMRLNESYMKDIDKDILMLMNIRDPSMEEEKEKALKKVIESSLREGFWMEMCVSENNKIWDMLMHEERKKDSN
jgi:hypothetical protein